MQVELPVKNKTILAVFAHPDDAEFSCAGSVAKWVQEGAQVFYLVCTNGNKGSNDPKMTPAKLSKIRKEEQLAAAKILGVKKVFFLNYPDFELEPSMEVKKDIVKVIRQVKPDTVITFDPKMRYSVERGYINHPDHVVVGEATLAAVYPAARDRLTFPEHEKLGLKPHGVSEVLMFNFDEANFFVDITNTLDKKLEAIKSHKSQVSNFSEIEKMITEWAKIQGKKASVKFAEGFKRILINF